MLGIRILKRRINKIQSTNPIFTKKMDTPATASQFYDQIFSPSPDATKAAFLRQLFARDELFRNAYSNYLNPTPVNYDLATLIEKLNEISQRIKTEIENFEWEVTDEDPEADYLEDISEVLNENFFVNITPMIEQYFQSGNLLLALRNLRVLELSLDLDWDKIAPRPIAAHGPELNEDMVVHEFNYLLVYFHTGIFSDVLLSSAKELIDNFMEHPAVHYPQTSAWKEISDMIVERLA